MIAAILYGYNGRIANEMARETKRAREREEDSMRERERERGLTKTIAHRKRNDDKNEFLNRSSNRS